MTPSEAAAELRRLSALLDDALGYLRRQVAELAEAENVYRKARARSWVQVDRAATAREKEDAVNAATADARERRDLADGMRQAALEAVRSRRQQISAWQSLMNAMRAEADALNFGPQVTP